LISFIVEFPWNPTYKYLRKKRLPAESETFAVGNTKAISAFGAKI